MTIRTILNRICTILFGAGLVCLKIHNLPIPVVSTIIGFIAYGLYLTAYSLWFFRTLLDPAQKEIQTNWYGFLQYKGQFGLSALLGILGCVLSIIGFFIPILVVPAAWLFLACNTLWTIGEYHQYKTPPQEDEQYSESYQSVYLSYAIVVTTITLLSTLATTLTFIFPPITIPLMIFSGAICFGLSLLAWGYWINATFGDHPTLHEIKDSYFQMSDLLELSPTPSNALFLDDELSLNECDDYSSLWNRLNEESSEIQTNVVYSASLL